MDNTASSISEKSLEVVDLTLPQQILLWALRHITHYGESAIRSGVSKVVGDDLTDTAVSAFHSLSMAIPRVAIDSDAIPEPWAMRVSPVEMDLIRLAALAQRNAAIALSVVRLNWVTIDVAEAVTDSVQEVAEVLRQADEHLPVVGAPSAPDVDTPLPSSLEVRALSEVETTLLVAIRVWVHAAINQEPTTPPLLNYLMPRRMGSMVQPICAVLRNTAAHATRLLDVHCPRCNSLSIDEARLLHAIGCAQREQRFTVEKVVATWLEAPHSHKLAMDAHELGRRMLQLDLALPMRNWRFPETHGGNSSWPLPGEQVAHTLH